MTQSSADLSKVKKALALKFVRYLKAVDENGIEITHFTAQPYCIGMYVTINYEGETIQLSLTHKEYPKWAKSSISKMEKNGHTVTVTESLYTDFITQQNIIDYIL